MQGCSERQELPGTWTLSSLLHTDKCILYHPKITRDGGLHYNVICRFKRNRVNLESSVSHSPWSKSECFHYWHLPCNYYTVINWLTISKICLSILWNLRSQSHVVKLSNRTSMKYIRDHLVLFSITNVARVDMTSIICVSVYLWTNCVNK